MNNTHYSMDNNLYVNKPHVNRVLYAFGYHNEAKYGESGRTRRMGPQAKGSSVSRTLRTCVCTAAAECCPTLLSQLYFSSVIRYSKMSRVTTRGLGHDRARHYSVCPSQSILGCSCQWPVSFKGSQASLGHFFPFAGRSQASQIRPYD